MSQKLRHCYSRLQFEQEGKEAMSKKEMMQELLEKMSEKEISLLYCFAIGMRAGSTGKPETMQEGEKSHDVQEM